MRSSLMLVSTLSMALSACASQKLALPSDPIGKAATCGVVAAANARSTDKQQQVSAPLAFDRQGQIVHYALLAGAADAKFSRDKAAAVIAQMQEIQENVTDGKWQALVQPCEAAFPEAALSREVALPSDPLQAETGCYMLGKFMTKALAPQGQAYEDKLVQYGVLNRKLDTKVASLMARRGIRSESAKSDQRDEALTVAAKLGPPAKVMDACAAKYT